MRTSSWSRWPAVMVIVALAAPMAHAQTRVKSGFNLFTPEQDAEIGRASAAEAERQVPILRDRLVEDYVSGVGEKLAATAPGPKFDYVFRVVDAPEFNAFALPGGYVYLNRGVLEAARNEGEVAGVLAHEIAHVALRHGTHQASKAYLAQAGLGVLGGLLGRESGSTQEIIGQVGGLGMNVLFLKYSREAESKADVVGAQMLARSSTYNPEDMISFFTLLGGVDSRKSANFLSSHPAPPQRAERIRAEAALMNVPLRASVMTQQLHDIQARLKGAPAGRTPRRGETPVSRPPTGRMDPPSSTRSRYDSTRGVYSVEYPSNWRVHAEGVHGVTIAPEGGIQRVGDHTEVVYGAILNHYEPFESTRRSPPVTGSPQDDVEEATEDLATALLEMSPYLRFERGSARRFRAPDAPSMTFAMAGRNPRTRMDERVVVVTKLLPDEHLIYMLFVTPQRDAGAYSDVLDDMADSLTTRDHRH